MRHVTVKHSILNRLVAVADKALAGESNDSEHDALHHLREALFRLSVGPVKPYRVRKHGDSWYVFTPQGFAVSVRHADRRSANLAANVFNFTNRDPKTVAIDKKIARIK